MYHLVDNLSHQAGAHALRVGADVLFNDDTITYSRSVRGSYSFSTLANFLSGVYNNSGFTQTFGTSVIARTNSNIGVYVDLAVPNRVNATPSIAAAGDTVVVAWGATIPARPTCTPR